MLGRIPQDVLDRVLAAHDVVEIVGRSVPLSKAGRAWKALCPFHEEKTPSFTVNPDRQTFKCFGCQAGGNVFGFLMKREGLTFPEAVRLLAAEKGIPVPDGGRKGAGDDSRIEGIRAALALAQDLYVRTLASEAGTAARAYLAHRGFPPEAVVEFGLGLSPSGWEGLLDAAKSKRIPAATLEDAGLVIRRESGSSWFDRFHGRLMFPIADPQGRIVSFGARALGDEQPKYLNGPETAVFSKGRVLYGLDRAKDGIRRAGYAILMEGYTDVLMAHRHGVTAAVAGMGTAFTTDQARLLARHATRVVLLYDGDKAGRLAAEKSLDVLLVEGLEVRIALLPEGKDVDEVLLEEGVERLDAIVSAAKGLFDFKIDQLATRLDLRSVRDRAVAAEELLQSAVKVRGAIERDLLLQRIAERLGVPEATLRAEGVRRVEGGVADKGRRAGTSPRAGQGAGPGASSATGTGSASGNDARDRDLFLEQQCLVSAVLHRPEFLEAVRASLDAGEIRHPGLAALWAEALAMADEGAIPTIAGVHSRVAHDAAAAETLAGLPEDVRFEEWVPDALRMRAASRALESRRQAVLDRLGGSAPMPQDEAAAG
jgi:DNA primase